MKKTATTLALALSLGVSAQQVEPPIRIIKYDTVEVITYDSLGRVFKTYPPKYMYTRTEITNQAYVDKARKHDKRFWRLAVTGFFTFLVGCITLDRVAR